MWALVQLSSDPKSISSSKRLWINLNIYPWLTNALIIIVQAVSLLHHHIKGTSLIRLLHGLSYPDLHVIGLLLTRFEMDIVQPGLQNKIGLLTLRFHWATL